MIRRPAAILCSGNIVYDTLVRPIDQPKFGATVWVDAIDASLGGNGANTSFGLGKLGVPVRLLGAAGSDSFGDFALARLDSAGVDTSAVERLQCGTSASVVLVSSSGERALLHRPGASREAFREPLEFAPRLHEQFSHYHLANCFALPLQRAQAGETLRRAREAGLTTSLDTGWDSRGEWMKVIGPCLPHLDLLFVNEVEARMLTGQAGPREAAAALRGGGARNVVVKLGPQGCLLCEDGSEPVEVPGFAVEVIDTTGAGDMFVAGFLAALHHGEDSPIAARIANAVGALNVTKLGSTGGVRSYQETLAWMDACRPEIST